MDMCEHATSVVNCNLCLQSTHSLVESYFSRLHDLPDDLDGYLDGICELLFNLFKPSFMYIQTHHQCVSYRISDEINLPSTYPHPPPGIPTKMCKRIVETRMPFMSIQLLKEHDWKDDELSHVHSFNAYFGVVLQDVTGRIWGTLAFLDKDVLALDRLDIQLICSASYSIAARLRADEQEQARHDVERHRRHFEKMEAIGMLAGGIAHEFNNVLSGIVGFSSYLMSKVNKESEIHRDMEVIDESAKRAHELTRQLQAFARPSHFPRQRVSINKVIEETLAMLKPTLDENIVISSTLSNDPAEVFGDAGQLGRMIMNVCSNAVEAMANSSGTLSVSSHLTVRKEHLTKLRVTASEPEKGFVLIQISDTGIGMSDDVKTHIFDPFFTTRIARRKVGLGLPIAYTVAANHGGDILVDSEERRGSIFYLYLSAHRPEEGT